MGEVRRPFAKAIGVLRWLIEAGDGAHGVREISAAMGAPVTTTHRALIALLQEGLVAKDESNRYFLSFEAYRLGLALAPKAPWRELALPFVRRVARETSEMSAFTVLDPVRLKRFTAARMESEHAVTVIERGDWKPLHAGASGLAVLAFLEEDLREEVIAHRNSQGAPGAIADAGELRRALEVVRQKGYAMTRGQRIPGVVGIGAPVFLANGRVMGSLYVSVPEQRFADEQEAKISGSLLACSAALSKQLAAAHH